MRILKCAFIYLMFTWNLSGQAFLKLDENFGEKGKSIIDFNVKNDFLRQLLTLPDKSILTAGHSNEIEATEYRINKIVLAKLLKNGLLAEGFGEGGKVILDLGQKTGYVGSILILPTGKILISITLDKGEIDNFVNSEISFYQFNQDGHLDQNFGEGGRQLVNFDDFRVIGKIISIFPNGKFLFMGKKSKRLGENNFQDIFFLAKFNADGSPDKVFGDNGIVENIIDSQFEIINIRQSFNVFTDDANKKVYWLGKEKTSSSNTDFAILRLDYRGTIDTLFGNKGVLHVDFDYTGGEYAWKMKQQTSGDLIIIGNAKNGSKNDFALVRIDTNGIIDKKFGNNGIVTTELTNSGSIVFQSDDTVDDILILDDNRILLLGSSANIIGQDRDLILAMYTNNGLLDQSFGEGGIMRLEAFNSSTFLPYIFALQKDKKIVLGGTSKDNLSENFEIVRLSLDFDVGNINFSNKENNTLIYPNPIKNTATLVYTLENQETLTIQLTNLNGQILKTYLQNKSQKAGDYQQAITLPNDLPKGFYFIKLASKNGQFTIKVVK